MAKTLVGALRVTLGLDSAEFAAGAARVQAMSAQMAKKLAVIGTAVSVVGAGVATAIRGAINTADDMGEMAQKLGVPVEHLTALRHAAKILGVEFEGLQAGLLRLSRGMADSPEKFDALGISVRDANGQLRPTADVLKELSDRFQAMPDGAEKTALAMDLFGKSGAAMIPMLNAGSAGITALMDEAQKMGLVISQETADSAGKFNENLDKLAAAASGLALIIASHLAPVLEQISAFIVDMATAFQNLSPAAQEFLSWAAGLTVVLGPLIIGLGLVVGAVGALVTPFTLTAGAIALLAAGIYAMLPTMEQWNKFWSDIGIIIEHVGTKIGEFVTGAIETLKTAFSDLWTSAVEVWEGIKSTIGGAIDYVTAKWTAFIDLLTGAVDKAKAAGQAIAEALSATPMNGTGGFEGGGGGGGKSGGGGMYNPASYSAGQGLSDGVINGAADQMMMRSGELAAVMTMGLQVMKDAAQIASPSKVTEGFGRNLAEGLAQGMNQGKDLVGQAAQGLTDTAAGAMKGIGDLGARIGDMFATAATNVLTGVESLREAVGKLLQQIAQLLINSAMKQLFGNIFGGLNLGGVPGYATGTMNAAAGWALVGEQGPELMRMRGGERVYDARQTDRMMGGAAGAGAAAQPLQATTNVYLDGELILNQIDSPQGEAVIARVNRRLGSR
jgi:phage-related protein